MYAAGVRAGMILLSFLLAALLPFNAHAQIDTQPKVQARLIAEQETAAPGSTVTVALEEVIRPEWHTYWSNPGEAGLPTTIDWTLPAGWKAGAIHWPYPKRLPVGPLMQYGYENKVWLLTDLTVPSDAKPGSVAMLKAAASWLVCRQVCIPEDAVLSLPLAIGSASAANAIFTQDFALGRAKLPMGAPWPARFHAGPGLSLFLASTSLAEARPSDVEFFPSRGGEVKDMAVQELGFAKDGLVLAMTPGKKPASTLDGVVEIASAGGSTKAYTVRAEPGAVPAAQFVTPQSADAESGMSWALALVFAFVGGLILNLMPCVLPVLAMKALAVASKAHAEKGEAAREGLAYGAGAVLSFLALGAAVLGLRAGGETVGWGFQLQNPAAVAAFALLIFAVGLNLSGVFEVPGFGAGDTLTRKGGAAGAFFTGVLAVAVAAPCTASFMATALGFALTQTTLVALSVFLALGFGFAAPFVLLGLFPVLLALLPKPGGWMLRFRQLLAFPMYGAAAWLLWVVTQEAGSAGLIAALAAMIALAFAAWCWDASRQSAGGWRVAGAIVALAALIGAGILTGRIAIAPATISSSAASLSDISTEPYSAARLTELRTENRPIFVNATAAWCITCLVNEKAAFTARVRDAFASRHVAYLLADYTNRNEEVAALLSAHGRAGVPLYLYYAPGASDAVVLPQILTESAIIDAIGKN